MNGIKEYSFPDLYEMDSGISTTKVQAGHGCPFASFSTVFNNYFLPDELPDLMDTTEKEQKTYSIKKGDILVTRTSETIDELAMSCVALKDYPKATYSGFTKRLRPKTEGLVYHKYLAFYLRSYLFRKTVTNNAFMTLRASFNEDIFSFLKLYLPDYSKQVCIGDLLYKVEQKIQLNNRINAELEGMVKIIYDYWFNQFDFPNDKGKPYKSSGGEMVWNEKLKREIPKGWKIKYAKSICELVRGVTYTKDVARAVPAQGYYPILRANNIDSKGLNFNSLVYVPSELISDEQKIKLGDIVITMSSGSKAHVGKIARAGYDMDYAYGAFCSKIKPKNSIRNFTYLYFKSKQFDKYIHNMCLGTNINNLTNEHIYNAIVCMPPEPIVDKFEAVISQVMRLVGCNEKESKELTKLRDWLLPMLMNGQVTVYETDKVVQGVFEQKHHEIYKVKQAARTFGNETEVDDTSELIREYLEHKRNETGT